MRLVILIAQYAKECDLLETLSGVACQAELKLIWRSDLADHCGVTLELSIISTRVRVIGPTVLSQFAVL